MDFVQIKERYTRTGQIEVYPDFIVKRSKDLLIKGSAFYAVWDEEEGMWSTNEYDAQRLIDSEIYDYVEQKGLMSYSLKLMSEFSSKKWVEFQTYMKHQPESGIFLDEKITFQNSKIRKTDYISKKLNYNLEEGNIFAYEELIGTLYEPEEKKKLEWAIGSIISGDAKTIQKFIVLYGAVGAGKSTILNIIQKLFEGYYTTFDAKALTSNGNSFATEMFRDNPLVAIQHDGDLSRIEDNTRLNSIVSHEDVIINEKHKTEYTIRPRCFMFLGTNKPVKITDSKSGIIRRLIDVRPSGQKVSPKHYEVLMNKIEFELGAIAYHCLEVYQSLGKNYYNNYKPLTMMFQTDAFFNFVENYFDYFVEKDGVSLTSAYEMYKQYCNESLMDFKMPRYKFREELKNYFQEFYDVTRIDGKQIRSYYQGFLSEKFTIELCKKEEEVVSPFVLDKTKSILDELLKDCPAQLANAEEKPKKAWDNVTTKLIDIDTSKIHYVMPPDNHIVIDFDLKEDGKKSFVKNMEAISSWPLTYAEVSKGGEGIHLHYIYEGDVEKLSSIYNEDIEIKKFTGKSSLRRKVTLCNAIAPAILSAGILPEKEKKMVNFDSVKSENGLRNLILRNLKKEIHPGTKPSCDFIYKILEDAYHSDLSYDVSDMRQKVLTFALGSTNHADYCMNLVNDMKFHSEETKVNVPDRLVIPNEELVFCDVEVFPNLFLINWKYYGKDQKVVRMINPSPEDVEALCRLPLVGFNNRRYDNHMLYARMIGYSNLELFHLSQKLIDKAGSGWFREAYNLSYTDVYDFSSAVNKKSLKKWEIQLGIHHKELGYPWDEPVPEDKWLEVAEYCDNDVLATEVVFDHLKGDYIARQILATMAGMTMNDTTNQLATKIIFGDEKEPQSEFRYRNLAEPVFELPTDVYNFLRDKKPEMMKDTHGEAKSLLPYFPGYRFEMGHSYYKGEDVKNGGWAWSLPGLYFNVGLLDIESQHPNSIVAECLFGVRFTQRFFDILYSRVEIKHEEWDELNDILDGMLTPFIEMVKNGELESSDLATALKTAINSVYGLSSASFNNPFKDPRNIDNIVAKRGALFMVDLKEKLDEMGAELVHIKTDSVKIANVTPEIIDFVMKFGLKYGYRFEHEATYDRMIIIDKSNFIAKYVEPDKHGNFWYPKGAQMSHPYTFKTLFSKEPVELEDLIETRSVQTEIYLDMNEENPEEHHYVFVGKIGAFVPIKPGCGGGVMLRKSGEDKYDSVNSTKGYRWMEWETVKSLHKEDDIDMIYYQNLVDDAITDLSKVGDFEMLVSDDDLEGGYLQCSKSNCIECPYFTNDVVDRKCKLGYIVDKQLPFK